MIQYKSSFDTSLKLKHLHPKYWVTWSLLFLLFLFSFCPIRLRDRFAALVAKFIYTKKFLNKRKKIAFINLGLCFPEYSEEDKDALMRKNIKAIAQISLSLGELFFRSHKHILSRSHVVGEEHIIAAEKAGKSIIFLGPHCYGLDFGGIAAINARGYPLSSMFKDYKNPIFDWFVTRYRTRFTHLSGKGALYHRSEGLKPAIKSLRDKTHFYYLPDEDHGRENSVFSDFYGTQKATLPMIGRLAKLGKAVVIPFYTSYNEKTAKYDVFFHAPLTEIPSGDELEDTKIMNRAIEKLIDEDRSQYMWALKLLRTRPIVGEKIY
ncbi:lauroyl-Kdo(2)-lipid IV(A) myristoyltransferase [Psychromonas sp. Urea-02u-13]|uniref:lauroyl-Kdo(2)-lipid IV(A) myristoyltransferase n=1 Tax=Psychromonas sp. Urea-02u-13 TaxID=2058326 RepID=UPI000C3341D0|nr:lauroyl-Kdo(2)-lipid IV(A) myristoyltransferase [Psychromonas sp. Urea-02u-13]PKG39602.1 lauroyl-Kdo(2)-lipid IV(A) myristoyltransferase [Psychromonas sp. Urea-02u-13]